MAEFKQIGNLIGDVLDGLAQGGDNSLAEERVRSKVNELCQKFPIYKGLDQR